MSSDRATVATEAAQAGSDIAAASFRQDITIETKAHKNDLVSAADSAAQERVIETIRRESDAPIIAEEEEGETGAEGNEEVDRQTTVPATGPAWIVDPIDGTANYVRGLRLWATSVAAVTDEEPVAAATALPAMSDTYVADADGTRMNGETVAVSTRSDIETFAVAVLGWGPHGQREEYAALSQAVIERCGDMRRFGSMQAALSFVASGGLDAAITTGEPNPWDSVAGVFMIRQAGGTVTDLDGNPWRYDSTGLVASNGTAHKEVLAIAQSVTE